MRKEIDNFSSGAAEYAAFRPQSPNELFDFIYAHVKGFDTAWDCGTGNGQAAVKLSERFKSVYGTDISWEQLQIAPKKPNVIYRQERAEKALFPDHCIDLVTVAQAIHWFDFDMFFAEVKRVAKMGALIAVWTYSNVQSTPEMTKVLDNLYWNITRNYWDKERNYVDDNYKTIPFPFEEIKTPEFSIKKQLTLDELTGYLGTWSGVKHYIEKVGDDPVRIILQDLSNAFNGMKKIEVTWPVHLRAGYIL